MQEIERKFLVKGEYKSLAYSKTHIEQGYFATEPGRTVRVRIRDDKGYNEGLVMAEIELESEDEPYEKPDFLGREVTGNYHYYNKYMLRRPYKLWKDEVTFEQSEDSTERL